MFCSIFFAERQISISCLVSSFCDTEAVVLRMMAIRSPPVLLAVSNTSEKISISSTPLRCARSESSSSIVRFSKIPTRILRNSCKTGSFSLYNFWSSSYACVNAFSTEYPAVRAVESHRIPTRNPRSSCFLLFFASSLLTSLKKKQMPGRKTTAASTER